MVDDQVLRGLLFAAALAAVLMYGLWAGPGWRERSWPMRLVIIGGGVLLIYVLAGQVKAFNLSIPFDAFSAVGLTGALIFDTGLTLQLKHQHSRHERG